MTFGLINTAILSIRKEPSEKSELIDEDFYGRYVKIIADYKNDWCEIITEYGYSGYVLKAHLIQDKDLIDTWRKGKKKLVWQASADVLEIPKVQGYCLNTLNRGALLRIVSEADENGWVLVALCDGTYGYIKEKFLSDYKKSCYETEDELRSRLVQTAYTYMGTQYRWGGKSPLGIDCSGLTFMAYYLNGIVIYRDATIKEGFAIKEISIENMKPGDLIYFPGHVAMYLGYGRYIHSTAKKGSDGVVINSLLKGEEDYREDLAQTIKAIGSIF